MLAGPPSADGAAGMGGFSFGAGGMPKPGEGPFPRGAGELDIYDLLLHRRGAAAARCAPPSRATWTPATARPRRCSARAAVCLARDVPRDATPGGCWTPAAAMDGAPDPPARSQRRRHLHPGNLNLRNDRSHSTDDASSAARRGRTASCWRPLTNLQSHPDGRLSDEEFHWLTFRAKGGFGLVMTCAAHVQRDRQRLSRPARRLLRRPPAGPHPAGGRDQGRGRGELGAAAPRRHPLARGADRREAGRPQRGRRDRRPGALHRRGRAAGRGLHRRGGARRAGRLRRRRAARRARLHPVRLPQPRHQPARPTATAARPENRARHGARHHRRACAPAPDPTSSSACASRPSASAWCSPSSWRWPSGCWPSGDLDYLDMSLWDSFKPPVDEAYREPAADRLVRRAAARDDAARRRRQADARRRHAPPARRRRRLRHPRPRRDPAPRLSEALRRRTRTSRRSPCR